MSGVIELVQKVKKKSESWDTGTKIVALSLLQQAIDEDPDWDSYDEKDQDAVLDLINDLKAEIEGEL